MLTVPDAVRRRVSLTPTINPPPPFSLITHLSYQTAASFRHSRRDRICETREFSQHVVRGTIGRISGANAGLIAETQTRAGDSRGRDATFPPAESKRRSRVERRAFSRLTSFHQFITLPARVNKSSPRIAPAPASRRDLCRRVSSCDVFFEFTAGATSRGSRLRSRSRYTRARAHLCLYTHPVADNRETRNEDRCRRVTTARSVKSPLNYAADRDHKQPPPRVPPPIPTAIRRSSSWLASISRRIGEARRDAT